MSLSIDIKDSVDSSSFLSAFQDPQRSKVYTLLKKRQVSCGTVLVELGMIINSKRLYHGQI